jgi:hypothetical protein
VKLPNSENAFIAPEKLTDYLLSEFHPGGKSKAKFFRPAGFSEINASLLKKSLLKIAKTQHIKNITESIHGIKYIIDGKIKTLNRKNVKVRTVWILEPNQNAPRFVTAYPV